MSELWSDDLQTVSPLVVVNAKVYPKVSVVTDEEDTCLGRTAAPGASTAACNPAARSDITDRRSMMCGFQAQDSPAV
jgi:hypothetical protein